MATTLIINGEAKSFEAPPDMPLLWVLRDILGMTGTKFGCGIAQCGACTVHVDGAPRRACVTPVSTVEGMISRHKDTQIFGYRLTSMFWEYAFPNS